MAASIPAKLPIPTAKLLRSNIFNLPGRLIQTELWFEVPLDYTRPDAGTIQLFGRRVARRESPLAPPDEAPAPKPYLVYLQGGPGFGCGTPSSVPMTSLLVEKGYQLLYLDHRGTGHSTPVSLAMLQKVSGSAQGQANYLSLMRQDNTVRDLEAVRQCLNGEVAEKKAKWSVLGQSYGGFVILSYLSMHPEGLREAYLTGGLAPVGRSAEEVYQATFRHTAARSKTYYEKFPEDVKRVRDVATFIESQGGIPLPDGGKLTVTRLLTMGIAFGKHGGIESVHNAILALEADLVQFGFFTRASLSLVAGWSGFDENIIYAILHEAIYCDGPNSISNWAAQRVGQSLDAFPWLRAGTKVFDMPDPLLFSGEMIFHDHFESYAELAPLREAAEVLAADDKWPALYNKDQLQKNEVPVYAVSYVNDMYVDYKYATDTANLVKGTKVFATNVLYHNGLRADTQEIFKQLFSLRDDCID